MTAFALWMLVATSGMLGLATVAEEVIPRTRVARTYGYIRVSTDKQALSPEAQRRTIEETAKRMDRQIDGWFQDAPVQNADGSWNDAASGKIPLPERKAGKELCDRLRKGDLLIVARVDRAFRRLSDCVLMLDRWERVGIGLVLCDFPMISDLSNPWGKAMVQMVAIFAEIERKLISQRTKEGLGVRKRKGQATNQFPGYGFKWEKKWDPDAGKRVKTRVANPEERQTMQQIVKWRLDGYGWDAITEHLRVHGVTTKTGTRWSRSRVIRAFQAELALQARENRSTK
jgi:DNA invertase Pin-like site-specific DNA recombinase